MAISTNKHGGIIGVYDKQVGSDEQGPILLLTDKDGQPGVTVYTNEYGGTLIIHNNHDDALIGVLLDTKPDYGRIWVNGKRENATSVFIEGKGKLRLDSKDGTTSINSTSLSLSDDGGDITVKLP